MKIESLSIPLVLHYYNIQLKIWFYKSYNYIVYESGSPNLIGYKQSLTNMLVGPGDVLPPGSTKKKQSE